MKLTTFFLTDNGRALFKADCQLLPLSTPLGYVLAHCPSRQLGYRAAAKLLHRCLSLASLWMVPQLLLVHLSVGGGMSLAVCPQVAAEAAERGIEVSEILGKYQFYLY